MHLRPLHPVDHFDPPAGYYDPEPECCGCDPDNAGGEWDCICSCHDAARAEFDQWADGVLSQTDPDVLLVYTDRDGVQVVMAGE